MTTLIAINTRDAVVMGSDSLGTMTRSLIDPCDLAEYFDTANSKIKIGPDGKPLLHELSQITSRCRNLPYNYITHVEKIFSLSPLEMGVMTSGAAAIGDRSVKNLILEFKSKDKVFRSRSSNYTLKSVGERLLGFLWEHYNQQYKEGLRPELELMLCGYDKRKYTPGVVRIYVHENKIHGPDYDLCLFLGGQTREIQRLVFGTDAHNKVRMIKRVNDLLEKYHQLLSQQVEASGIKLKLNMPGEFGDELKLFNGWDLQHLEANWSAFSEQNALECVDYLINVMIRSQQFSIEMPSVGGRAQIAIIKKDSGFSFISKIDWELGDYPNLLKN